MQLGQGSRPTKISRLPWALPLRKLFSIPGSVDAEVRRLGPAASSLAAALGDANPSPEREQELLSDGSQSLPLFTWEALRL